MKKGQKAPPSKKPVGVGKAPSSQGTASASEGKKKRRKYSQHHILLCLEPLLRKL